METATGTGLQADVIERPAASTNIKAYGYRQAAKTLVVEFKSGKTYEYQDVPEEVFEQMRQSPSAGSFLAKEIKHHFNARPVAK